MKKLLPILILALLQSCASTYHPVHPAKVKHNMHEIVSNVSFSYKYDAIAEHGNKKYVHRAKRKGYQIVSYTITNNSKDSLVMGKNIVFMANNEKIVPSDALYKSKPVKQYPIGFLPYLSASYFVLYTGVEVKSNGTATYDNKIPIGFIISAPIVLGNMIVASFNNTAFYDNLRLNDMNGKQIAPNESVSGILVFKNKEQIPLTISKIL